MPIVEHEWLGLDPHEKYISESEDVYDNIVKRIIIYDNHNKPLSFAELLKHHKDLILVVGTRFGTKYRNHGYATKAVSLILDWYKMNRIKNGYGQVIWWVRNDNTGSNALAKKFDFSDGIKYGDGWMRYSKFG